MTQIIDKKLKDYRPRPSPKPGMIREWIAAAVGAVTLYVILYGMALVGYGFGV